MEQVCQLYWINNDSLNHLPSWIEDLDSISYNYFSNALFRSKEKLRFDFLHSTRVISVSSPQHIVKHNIRPLGFSFHDILSHENNRVLNLSKVILVMYQKYKQMMIRIYLIATYFSFKHYEKSHFLLFIFLEILKHIFLLRDLIFKDPLT